MLVHCVGRSYQDGGGGSQTRSLPALTALACETWRTGSRGADTPPTSHGAAPVPRPGCRDVPAFDRAGAGVVALRV